MLHSEKERLCMSNTDFTAYKTKDSKGLQDRL